MARAYAWRRYASAFGQTSPSTAWWARRSTCSATRSPASRLDRVHDPGVQGAATLVQEGAVRDIVGQGVLERVFEVREEAPLVQEVGGLEPGQPVPKLVFGEIGDRLEQRKRHVVPDHGGGLEQPLLIGGEAIDARREHGLDGGRHADRGHGAGQAVRAALADQRAVFHHGADALLQEERIPFGPLGQQASERLKLGGVAEQGIEQGVHALGRERVDPKLGEKRAVSPGRPVLRAVVDQQHDPGGWQALDDGVQQGLGLRVDPVEVLEDQQQPLLLALPQQQAAQRVDGLAAALGRIERRPAPRHRPGRPSARAGPAGSAPGRGPAPAACRSASRARPGRRPGRRCGSSA